MASRKERLSYLNHHLSYELMMLRYTRDRLHDTRHKLMWNAFLEAFAVHARNLHLFLTNDKDSRNFRAADYNDKFRASQIPVEIKHKVAVYIVHPAKTRSDDGDDKFNLDRAERAFAWIEAEFARFLGELPEDDKKYWNPKWSDPANYNVDLDPDDRLWACTHPIANNISIQTHTSHIFTWEFPTFVERE
jgi:hypothetical protein